MDVALTCQGLIIARYFVISPNSHLKNFGCVTKSSELST